MINETLNILGQEMTCDSCVKYLKDGWSQVDYHCLQNEGLLALNRSFRWLGIVGIAVFLLKYIVIFFVSSSYIRANINIKEQAIVMFELIFEIITCSLFTYVILITFQ